jgi:hypothetical protein
MRSPMSEAGRLSTQKKFRSSTALKATVFPEPDRPVIITTRESLPFPPAAVMPPKDIFFFFNRVIAGASSFYRFDKTEISVAPEVYDVDVSAFVIQEDIEVLVKQFHLH